MRRDELNENLKKWFKEKWVRFGPDGKIRGACARGDDSEGKPKCLPQSKAQSLGKKGRKYAASKKRREDPNPERKGKAINVSTKKKSNESVTEAHSEISGNKSFIVTAQTAEGQTKKFRVKAQNEAMAKEKFSKHHSMAEVLDIKEEPMSEEQLDELKCWPGYSRVKGIPAGAPGSCKKTSESVEMHEEKCPHCNGPMFEETMMTEKQDACYYKVKSRYKVWPSAYASGALVQCRKKGAKNWGNKSESINEAMSAEDLSDAILNRIESVRPELFTRYGVEPLYNAVQDVASFHAGMEELGTSDINGMIREVLKNLEQHLDEAKKEVDYDDPEWDAKVLRLKKLAKEGPRKTVWDPVKKVYKTVPINAPKEPVQEFVQGYNMNQGGIRKLKPKHVPNQDEIQRMSGIMEGIFSKTKPNE